LYSKLKIIGLLTVFVGLMVLAPESPGRIRGTNQHYQQGDWVTYSSTRFVRDLAIGQQYVYFATTGGITRFNYFSEKWDFPWTTSNGLADNDIYIVAMDFNTGYLWCANGQGLSYLDPASQFWYNVYYDEIGLDPSEGVTSIGFGQDRRVYLLTSNNRWLASENTATDFRSISRPEDESTITWFGEKRRYERKLPPLFMSDGFLFDERNRVIEDMEFRNFKITSWIQDNYQNIWIGTWGLGAARANVATSRLDLLQYGLWDQAVDAIARDGEDFWVGGIQGSRVKAGITEWGIFSGEPRYYEAYLLTGFDNGEVSAIAVDDYTVWIGTHDGLTRYDRKKGIWRTYTIVNNLVNNWVNDIVVDEDAIWVATDGGVSYVVKKTVGTDSLTIRHVLYPKLRNIAVYDLDIQGNLLWMGTEFGVFVYDKKKKEGSFYTSVADPVEKATYAITCYKNEVWYATDYGIAGFNSKTGKRFDPPARYYLKNVRVYRLTADEKTVWAATDNGALKYDRENKRWVRFSVQDGLPSDEVLSLYLDGDYIWFGTPLGLTQFYWNAPYRID